MQHWADKFYGLSIEGFTAFSDRINLMEQDTEAVSELRSFFEEIDYDLSVYTFKPYLGVMRYVSSY